MKLYATINSERNEKGQGGNKFLDIDVGIGNSKLPMNVLSIRMRCDEKGEQYNLVVIDRAGKIIHNELLTYYT